MAFVKRLLLEKKAGKALQTEKVEDQLSYLKWRAVYGSRAHKGWKAAFGFASEALEKPAVKEDEKTPEVVTDVQVEGDKVVVNTEPTPAPVETPAEETKAKKDPVLRWKYNGTLDLVCIPKRKRKGEVLEAEFLKIKHVVEVAARGQGWVVTGHENLPEDHDVSGFTSEVTYHSKETVKDTVEKEEPVTEATPAGEVVLEPTPVA